MYQHDEIDLAHQVGRIVEVRTRSGETFRLDPYEDAPELWTTRVRPRPYLQNDTLYLIVDADTHGIALVEIDAIEMATNGHKQAARTTATVIILSLFLVTIVMGVILSGVSWDFD